MSAGSIPQHGASSVGIELDGSAVVVSAPHWRLVAREPLCTRVAEVLVDPSRRGIIVLGGPAGIGKTQLAHDIARVFRDDEPVTVRASPALADVALGALVPLLESLGVDVPDRVVHAELLSAMSAALTRRDVPVCVVVDDAPRLDRVSAAVLQQMAHHARVEMILTVRNGESLDASFAQLLSDGSAVTFAVEPWSLAEVDGVLTTVFDAPVDPATCQLLHSRSGGNPLYLRELVEGTCAAGAMGVGPHGVVLRHPVPSDRLVDLVSRHFDRLTDGQVELIEVLAAGQPLPLDALATSAIELVELERSGLIEIESALGPTQLQLGHPVYGEVVRVSTPPLRWRERQRAAAHLLSDGDVASRFRSTCLRLDVGDEVPAEDLVEAARRANGLLDHATAVRMGSAAIEAGAAFWGNLTLGTASSALGDVDVASTALLAAVRAADDDERRALAAQGRGMHLAIRMGRPGDALDQAEEALRRITDPGWVRFLVADVAKWRLMAGRDLDDLFDGPLRIGSASGSANDLDGTSDDVAALLNEQVLGALVAVMNGDLAAADRAVTVGVPLALAHPEVLPNAQDLLGLSRYLVLSFGGSLDAAEAFGLAGLADAELRRGEPEGMWAYALAVMDLHRGRAGSAARRAALATSKLDWRDFTGLRPAARSLHATALAQLGRFADARSQLEQVDASAMDDPKVDMQSAQAQAWLALSVNDLDRAVSLLRTAGRRGMDSSHRCLGALTSYEVVRLGRADAVVDDLVEAADGCEGQLLAALAEHAVAAASRNADALDAVSIRLEQLGVTLAAADASAQAGRAHLRAGRSEAERRSSRRAQGLGERCDGRRGTEVADGTSTLTPREREVALLAARRERSREIGASLGISVRTVDNHLASVYRKLGVVGRDEMSVALAEMGLIGQTPS